MKLHPVFVQHQEAAHLYMMSVNCSLCSEFRFLVFFPQQMDLLGQDTRAWRNSRSRSRSSGLTGLSCLVIAALVLFVGPRWNVLTAFDEYDQGIDVDNLERTSRLGLCQSWRLVTQKPKPPYFSLHSNYIESIKMKEYTRQADIRITCFRSHRHILFACTHAS